MHADYTHLSPMGFSERLKAMPLAYLPLGTLEWHGLHMPLGSDGLQSQAFCRLCADTYGGIVMPPVWLGPDGYHPQPDGSVLIGMDTSEYTQPNQQLTGSAYYIDEERFLDMIDAILFNLKRAGFKAVFADGHGPSRIAWCRAKQHFEKRYGLVLIGIEEKDYLHWQIQMDHGGINETSLMLHYHPGLVDQSVLGEDRSVWPLGTGVEDARDATAAIGRTATALSLAYMKTLLEEKGLLP